MSLILGRWLLLISIGSRTGLLGNLQEAGEAEECTWRSGTLGEEECTGRSGTRGEECTRRLGTRGEEECTSRSRTLEVEARTG